MSPPQDPALGAVLQVLQGLGGAGKAPREDLQPGQVAASTGPQKLQVLPQHPASPPVHPAREGPATSAPGQPLYLVLGGNSQIHPLSASRGGGGSSAPSIFVATAALLNYLEMGWF